MDSTPTTSHPKAFRISGYRVALGVGMALVLIECKSEEEKRRKVMAQYVATTREACQGAKDNVAMVENVRASVGTPAADKSGRHWVTTMCRLADKALREQEPLQTTR